MLHRRTFAETRKRRDVGNLEERRWTHWQRLDRLDLLVPAGRTVRGSWTRRHRAQQPGLRPAFLRVTRWRVRIPSSAHFEPSPSPSRSSTTA